MLILSKKMFPFIFLMLILSLGLSLEDMQWKLQEIVLGETEKNYSFISRAGHTSIEINSGVYVFGGETKNGFLNEVWRYDNAQGWSLEFRNTHPSESANDVPLGRSYHAMEKVQIDQIDKFFIFGGIGNESFMSDIWTYNIMINNNINNKWEIFSVADSTPGITSRAGASAHYGKNGKNGKEKSLFIFFGENEINQQFSSIWVINNTWKLVWGNSTPDTISEEGPGARAYHSSWWHEVGITVMIYGGYGKLSQTSSQKGVFGDVWTFNFENFEWKRIGGSDSLNPLQKIVYRYSYHSLNTPQGRCRASTFKINSYKYILFGGSNCMKNETVFFNDLWFFSFIGERFLFVGGNNFTVNSSSDLPGSREGAVMINNTDNNLLLLFGYGQNNNISSMSEPEFLNEEWMFKFPNCDKHYQFYNISENSCVTDSNYKNDTQNGRYLKNMVVGIISGCSSLLLLLIIIIAVLVLILMILKKKKKDSMDKVLEEEAKQTEAKININRDLFKLNYKELEIKEKIGSGGSNSSIFLAKWNSSLVAFKCFQLNDFDTDKKFSEFEKEVEIMISISHPFILRFYGATVAPPRVGIVMEYCSKGDVRSFIENNKSLKEKKRIEILSQIAQGLKYLHSKNIWHRDMKPENVLISDDLSIRIIDFGLSRIMEDINQSKTKAIGTSKYMAPEIVLGEDYSEKIDIFSFGIMIFEILSGNFEPFGKKLQFRLEFKIANDPNFRPDVNEINTEKPELVDLMKSCWKASPIDRPGICEVVKILEKLL